MSEERMPLLDWQRLRTGVGRFREWAAQLRTQPVEDQEYADFRRRRDKEENEAGKLPDGEAVALPCIWVMEGYTPSRIEGLFAGLEKLGWLDDTVRNQDRDLVEFVRELRSRFVTGGSYNLGPIVSSDTPAWGMYLQADLPPGIRSADAQLVQLIPSSTILCMRFVLDETVAREIEEPFNKYYRTYHEPIARGHRS